MTVRSLSSGPFCQFLCVLLSVSMATGPAMMARAQQPAGDNATDQIEFPSTITVGDHQIIVEDAPTEFEFPREIVIETQGPDLPTVSGDTTLLAAPHAGKIDLRYVSPHAVAVAALRPAQLMKAEATQMLPVEVASAAGLEWLGIDPADVVDVVAFVEPPLVGPPLWGAAATLSRPLRYEQLPDKLRAHTEPAEIAGRQYQRSTEPMLPSICLVDDQTLLVAPDVMLRRLVAAADKPKSGPLLDQIHEVAAVSDLYVAVDLKTLRPLIGAGLALARSQAPPEFQKFLEAPSLVSLAELTLNVSNPGPTTLVIRADDEASAERLIQLAHDAAELWRQQMISQLEAAMVESGNQDNPIAQAYLRYLRRMAETPIEPMPVDRDGATITLFRMMPGDSQQQQMVTVAVIGILVALLLPAVQAAREAARRNVSLHNLKQLILALQCHADGHREKLPAHAIYSGDGKPLLSWRVAILPYIEEGALYNQFRLDEPWDSPHNRQLVAQMPEVYQNPNLGVNDGKTNYLAVVGKPCVFDGTATGIRLGDIADGTSKTIALVEADADRAVIWTKPDDWQFDPANPTSGLGHLRPGVWQAGWADGRASAVSNDVPPDVVKAYFTRNGREHVTR